VRRKLTVSSPALLSAPVEMAASTLLNEELIYPLAQLTLSAAIDRRDTARRSYFVDWPAFNDALPLWEVWDAGGPLVSGREPLVRWLYANSQVAPSERQPLPAGYMTLCRLQHIWPATFQEMLIPFVCTDADKWLASSRSSLAPLTLLKPMKYQHEIRSSQNGPYSITVTGETVIEYIVATYGRDKLPALIATMGNYTTFDELIPALFGVSRGEFEAGWQRYLAQRYGDIGKDNQEGKERKRE
jgi:hypothetical protein